MLQKWSAVHKTIQVIRSIAALKPSFNCLFVPKKLSNRSRLVQKKRLGSARRGAASGYAVSNITICFQNIVRTQNNKLQKLLLLDFCN